MFLRGLELFQPVDAAELDGIAQRAEVQRFAPGAVILSPSEDAAAAVGVVWWGAVDLVDHGRALDRLVPGELFGHPSMLAGLPPGFEVRAAEETICLRIAAADILPVLGRPSGLRYVARTLLARPARPSVALAHSVDPTRRRVAELTHEPAVVCEPDLSIRDAARLMVQRGASCVLVRGADGLAGIVTDRDLRSRVLAAGRSGQAPVAEIMSSAVITSPPEQRAADATLTMLDRGIRHLPIVGSRGEIAGVLRDVDLLAVQARTSFVIRTAIAEAIDVHELRRAARQLDDAVIALHDARMNEAQISSVISVIADALIRRLVDLAPAGTAVPDLAWLALGSHGRREAMPSSDLDSAIAWKSSDADAVEAVDAVAQSVVDNLAACGFPSDTHGAVATNRLFARSSDEWDTRIRALLADPGGEHSLILISLLCDGRVVTGGEWLTDPFEALRGARARPLLLRLLLRVGLARRPPTGFLRNVVVEHSGEHRGQFDIKLGGLLPIVNLARYAGVAAGSRVTGTVERLRVAADAGTLPRETAASLEEAFDLLTALRLDHQVDALRAGRPADDFVDPRTLTPLARRFLRDAFRAIASIQRTLENDLEFAGPGT